MQPKGAANNTAPFLITHSPFLLYENLDPFIIYRYDVKT